jgi:hypothetical protein
MRWAGHVARIKEVRNALKFLIRKPEGNVPILFLPVIFQSAVLELPGFQARIDVKIAKPVELYTG